MNTHPFGSINADTPQLFKQDTYADLQNALAAWEHTPSKMEPVKKAAIANNWDSFIFNAASALKNTAAASDNEFRLIHGNNGKPIGYVFTRSYAPNSNGVAIKFYIANWSLGAAVLKEQRFGSWNNLNASAKAHHIDGDVSDFDAELNGERNGLTKLLKLHVLDWGLGDAALYLGEAGQQFQKPIHEALRQLIRDSRSNDRIAVVTHSLGSTITLDALTPFLHDTGLIDDEPMPVSGGKLALLARPVEGSQPSKPSGLAFYMFANQYGLLKIGGEQSFAKLSRALQGTSLARSNKAALQVYAFTDPNDILSYPLNIREKPLISVCNVYVRNRALNLGFASDPLEAHLNYEKNRSVLDSMLDSPKNVRLPAAN